MTRHARIVAPNFVETGDGVRLFYRDWPGAASNRDLPAVVFVAGWSMSSSSWGYQMMALQRRGLRCIAFDRRGHGRSSDPGGGYDFDTLAADLAAVIEALDLKRAVLVGHSMGCNEIVRYLTRSGDGAGGGRVERIALLGPTTPGVAFTPTNPDGVDPRLLEQFREEQLLRDFPRWIEENIEPFVPGANATTKAWLAQMALDNSLQALHDCHAAVQGADMADELAAVELPVLLIAGAADVSAPLELTAKRSAALLRDVHLRVVEDAAHGMFLTHAGRVNADLLEFIGEPAYIGGD